jgi:methanogenic corrinoid protein MtbC1
MADLNRHPGMRKQTESSTEAFPGIGFLPEFVSGEVFPELMRSYGLDRSWLIRNTPTITQTDVNLFCDLVNSGDQSFMMAALTALRSQGISSHQLLLELLTHVAQELGRRWTSDETDFSSVTIALGHLQQLRRAVAQFDEPGLLPSGPPRRALLATAPGEQHDFGLMIVDHFMHLAGWDVRTSPQASAEEIISIVSKNSFEIAGLSLSGESYLMSLERVIATIRRVSKNSNIGILVGGSLFIERPELALLIGADATASDGQEAVRQAERIALSKASSAEQLME